MFCRSSTPRIDACGFESYSLECKECGAPLAGIIDPYDEALLFSVGMRRLKCGLAKGGRVLFSRKPLVTDRRPDAREKKDHPDYADELTQMDRPA
jgi:hypothetical protein